MSHQLFIFHDYKFSENNPELIKSYEEALFILCLDSPVKYDSHRSQAEEQMRQMLTGGGADENGTNRWFDVSLQTLRLGLTKRDLENGSNKHRLYWWMWSYM